MSQAGIFLTVRYWVFRMQTVCSDTAYQIDKLFIASFHFYVWE